MLTPTKPVKSCECSGSCGDCCCCTKEAIGLGNVDNTSDLNKPLSTDMINALSGKVGLDIFTQLKNRVLALENTITEIPDLKVRISECELDIKDHYEAIKRLQSTTKSMADTITELGNRVTGVNDDLVTVGTRVDALEAKDSNNVKLSGVNVQTIQGTLKANDPANGATDKTLVTANWVSQTGNSAPNNLIHKTGNEIKTGSFTANLFVTNGNNGMIVKSNLDLDSPPNVQKQVQLLKVEEADSTANVMFLQLIDGADGVRSVRLNVYSSNGTRVILQLMTIQADGTTTYPWS